MCDNKPVTVTLRVEGQTTTIFEGPVSTKFHRITVGQGTNTQKYHCNGLNNDTNPCPGPTCTTALDDGSRTNKFPYLATYYKQYDDLFITSIKGETPSNPYSWAIARNFVYLNVGGCQQIVQADNEVLFAYAHTTQAHPVPTFLKLSGPISARPNTDVTLKVTSGTGAPIEGVGIYQLSPGAPTLLGQTDANGLFVHRFTAGTYEFKADKRDDFFTIRSNKHKLQVAA